MVHQGEPMPDRIIRERCRRSPTLQRISDAAERAWWRLTVSADDYGRFEADPEILLAELMPRKPAGWTPGKMRQVIAEWADGEDPLIHLYRVEGDKRVYGHSATFHDHQRERSSRPKYPDPPCGGSPQSAAKCRESLQSAAYSESRESLSTESRESGAEIASASPPGGTLPQRPWPDPEALAWKYNAETPDESPAVTALPGGRLLSPSRRTKAAKYLKLFPQEEFWTKAFQEVHKSRFLRGLSPKSGHEHFLFSFDWMLTNGQDHTENIVKVAEGKYRD